MEKEHKKIKNKNILIIGEGSCCGKNLFQKWMNYIKKIKK
jgi:hypothetical protein